MSLMSDIGTAIKNKLTPIENSVSLMDTHMSVLTSYHLLQGNLAVSNSTITKGFDTKLYTSGSVTTGIDMSTQWGSTAEEKYGGLIWLKDRVEATNNFLYDTIRGATKEINSNTTDAEATLAGGLTAFNSTGFTVGADTGHNSTTNNMVSWNFQTTHRITGTTNHGKAYTCHYNPFTGFTIVKYEGSGIAGHEIPHHLGRKLGFVTTKNLSVVNSWNSFGDNMTWRLQLNSTVAQTFQSSYGTNTDYVFSSAENDVSNQYIMYGWANSYFDESNKLIGNYELVTYQGTGAAGNKVKTKGKPAGVMTKRVDGAGDWATFDNQRGLGLGTNAKYILPNSSNVEGSLANTDMSFVSDGFIVGNTSTGINAAGGQYIALVAYDTNSNGGGSYYPLASDTANVQVNNALIPLAKGIDGNGVKNSIVVANETITGVTYTAGKNYLYKTDSSYGVKPYEPRYLKSELVRRFAGEQPDYFDVESNKWFNTDAGSELVTNGTFTDGTSGWTSQGTITVSNDNSTLKIVTNSSNNAVYQQISVVPNTKYKIKWTVEGNSNQMFIGTGIKTGEIVNITANNGSWGNISTSTEFNSGNNTTLYICLYCSNAGAYTVRFDNISVFPVDIVPTTEITESRNYMNHIVHTDNDGGVLYVEELPKIEYKDVIKANEFKGKNACTFYANIDMTTTPPTVRESYNLSTTIRTGTGLLDVYFEDEMDTNTYCPVFGNTATTGGDQVLINGMTTKKLSIATRDEGSVAHNLDTVIIHIMGGKN